MFDIKKNCENDKTFLELIEHDNLIDGEKLLEKYDPEGLYLIARKLMDIADRDINDALKDSGK